MIDARESEGDVFDVLNGERILTPQEVAYILDTSTTTIASLVKSNRLQARTFGKVVRFLESDVLAFIGVKYEAV
jgi:excisionase family DNA binding protein